MIRRLSAYIVGWLEKEGSIAEGSHNLFLYTTYSFLFGLLPLFIVMVLGAALNMLREGLLMILPFMMIRKFSGGYHLKSSKQCIFLSTLSIMLAFCCIIYFLEIGKARILTFAVCNSTVSLCVLSPIDNEDRRLTEKETKYFRVIARSLAVLMLICYIVLLLAAHIDFAIPIGVGITLSAALQIPCLFQCIYNKWNNDSYSK